MTGTIFVSADARFGIRTIDFEWIAHELRSRVTAGNESALSSVLKAHDEQGMDMLLADKLDANDFRLFAQAFDGVTTDLQSTHGECAMLTFLRSVQSAIRNDSRWLDAKPRAL